MPIDIIQNIEKGVLPNTATTQLFLMDVEKFLDALPMQPIFDLVVTSPPYNIGKEYENQVPLSDYYDWQKRIIEKIYPRLKDNGSICWQVGNYVENGSITPLDIELAPIFKELNLHLRNRIIWHFGHGLHNKNRFSGRYEVIMWYTKSDTYTFNLDAQIAAAIRQAENPTLVAQTVKSVLDTTEELEKEKKKKSFIFDQVMKAATALTNAVSNLDDSMSKEGIGKQIENIEGALVYLKDWIK